MSSVSAAPSSQFFKPAWSCAPRPSQFRLQLIHPRITEIAEEIPTNDFTETRRAGLTG
jgi:hypothetical protein